MSARTRLTAVEDVPERGGWLFTVQEPDGDKQEVILVRLADGVAAWKNFCQHETDQELHRDGIGTVMRDGGIVCPKHGSVFDAETGYCDNGKAAGSTLVEVDVTAEDGQVYLTDADHTYLWDGGFEEDDDDDMPGSTSHLTF
jgi:nitrite reductase/ring-hydroxylating ferredoxin subunit